MKYGEDVRVCVLGIGQMGSRIARRFLSAGYSVKVWNRTSARCKPLVAYGAQVVTKASDAVRGSDFVVVCLFDGAAVEEVLFARRAVTAARPGTIIIDMSSIEPRVARNFHRRLARREIGYVDAPSTGGVIGAEAGTLLIMAGGSEEDIDKASELLDVLGRVVRIGDSGAGQFAKIANQLLMAATAAALAEGLMLAERGGVDSERILESLRGGLVHSRALELYGRRMLAHDFQSRGASASIQLKDLRNALSQAGLTHSPMPLTEVLAKGFDQVVREHGDVDKSGIWLALSSETSL